MTIKVHNAKSKPSPLLVFMLAWTGISNLFWIATMTIWREVIFVPAKLYRPSLSKDYWFWFVDERVPIVAYEPLLIWLSYAIKRISFVVFLIATIYVFIKVNKSTSPHLMKKCSIVLLLTVVLYILVFFALRMLGEPYYLWMTLVTTEIQMIGFFSLLQCLKINHVQ